LKQVQKHRSHLPPDCPGQDLAPFPGGALPDGCRDVVGPDPSVTLDDHVELRQGRSYLLSKTIKNTFSIVNH